MSSTKLPQGKSITRTVRCKPRTCKVCAVVVTIRQHADGAMITLRPLRHKREFDIDVAELMDLLHWRAAKSEARKP